MVLIKQTRTLCKELEPLKMFILYERGVVEKLKKVASKYKFTTVFAKTKDLRGQIRTKEEDKMETSGVVYELGFSNCFKNCTGETVKKLKKRIKGHKDNGEKSQKDKKITGLSQNMKTTGHSSVYCVG